jgi:H+-transporting ATPase
VTIDPSSATYYGLICDNSQNFDNVGAPSIGGCNADGTYNATPPANMLAINLANDSAFTLPVISLVIITILNDGTMITIAHDKVIPEKRPQRWAMFEVSVVSGVLGGVACISSMVLLAIVLQASYKNCFDASCFIGNAFGSGGGYVTWMEARTIMYLKISISDFLTLFAARTRTWFWERRPGYALGVACIVATTSSTLLSLFWDDVFQTSDA